MAHKKFGGWIVEGTLFAQVKIANELWYDRNKEKDEKCTHLFRLSWYEQGEGKARLYTLTILWLSIQVGF